MTLSERATGALRRALIDGTFTPGESITEREACDFLGMSRSPIRSAFQTLASEGLLIYEANCGYRIRRVSSATIVEAYQVRGALEGIACRQLARSGIAKKTHTVLTGCVELGQELLSKGGAAFQHQEWRDMNRRFHRTILEATNNETLLLAFNTAANHPMAPLTYIPALDSQPDFGALQLAQVDHEQILKAIVARDSQRASARMHEHIEVASEFLEMEIKQRELNRSDVAVE